jgi:hypothetical protein
MTAQMEDIWFVEELIHEEAAQEVVSKGILEKRTAEDRDAMVEVRAKQPRSRLLSDGEKASLLIDARATALLVRLGFEFALPLRLHEKGYKIVWARCGAYLMGHGPEPPRVVDLLPRDLYEGSTRRVQISVNPTLKLGNIVEASAVSAEASADVGQVQPVVVGYAGSGERAPYWEISPKDRNLVGIRDFWLFIEAPTGCEYVELAATVEAEVQHRFGNIPLGPRETHQEKRPRHRIHFRGL